MFIQLAYISGKNPQWLNQACEDYCMRVRKPWRAEQQVLPLSKQHGRNDLQAVEEESANLLKASKNTIRVALDSTGRQMNSDTFAHWIDQQTQHNSKMMFLLGGPSGFNSLVLEQSNFQLSLSLMTWPHALARLMICEQLYRASTIIHGGSYHK